MDNNAFITIVTAEEEAGTRGLAADMRRVTERISVEELRRQFNQFMQNLEAAFAVDEVRTSAGIFELREIQFCAELSANGEFKLLGTGAGVAAGSALTFVLVRK